MPVNRTQNSLDKRLVKTVASLKREMAQLKTPQKIGADIISVDRIPSGAEVASGPWTVAAGSYLHIYFTVFPASDTLTLWNFLHTVYVDTDNDSTYIWPGGSNVNPLKHLVTAWIDWELSNDTTNSRKYVIYVLNNDGISHDYYIHNRAYLPHNPGASD